ncbi:adenylosuccinate lyase [Erysipelothrix sp. HDW6C]|uniref:adenylosuccinate lyase n=1 Tax=Erysipelothrix sp. HDW6C TaxID=2714930 RepID=UPI0014076D1B|nr:adenylosuccinate lyase [Erysipelothrix sp. HDW6C]QIK70128.1 adenylosuccinate lyase [Erysipelothrix sp. HDW6C]
MIDRYARPEMQVLFTDAFRFETWLNVELYAAEAFAKQGIIPHEDMEKLRRNASFDIARIYEIEQETRHDVVAFTRAVSETLGDEKRWIHYGLTSTDVVDTAYGVIYKRANDILEQDIVAMIATLKKQAIRYKNTPCIGRTHGIHADITSFGLKFALWYDEMERQLERFKTARRDIEAGKISGAVGNFANTAPFVQDYVCEKLGLTSTNISTQVLQRDRHAAYMSVVALIATSIEKMATEIRHLQRTEVGELEEFFNKGQKGSSAMPHKRNPIGSENMSGCARVIRGYMVTAFENVALWHERDISHSSAERIIFPDAIMLLDYMINRFNRILDGLVVYEERMLANINLTHGVIFAQRVMTVLIDQGAFSREDAYDVVQPLAMTAYSTHVDFRTLVREEPVISATLTPEQLNDCFDLDFFLKQVDTIFERVGIHGK